MTYTEITKPTGDTWDGSTGTWDESIFTWDNVTYIEVTRPEDTGYLFEDGTTYLFQDNVEFMFINNITYNEITRPT